MKISNLEARRGIFHILVGIAFLLVVLFIPYGEIFLFFVFIFGIFLSFIASQFKIPGIYHFLCFFERECNKNFPGKGVIYFFLGSLLSLRLFEQNIAFASIAILTFADSISHFVGSNFGRTKSSINRKKNIEGTIAGILAGTLFASFFIHPFLALVGSAAAMLLELAGIKMGKEEIDDNLLIPLVAGTTMFLVLRFLPI